MKDSEPKVDFKIIETPEDDKTAPENAPRLWDKNAPYLGSPSYKLMKYQRETVSSKITNAQREAIIRLINMSNLTDEQKDQAVLEMLKVGLLPSTTVKYPVRSERLTQYLADQKKDADSSK